MLLCISCHRKRQPLLYSVPTFVGVRPKIHNCIAKKFCIMENNIRRVRKAKIFIEKVKANRLMQESTRGQF